MILTYYKKANGQIDEVVAVSKKIKKSDIQTASIILDFKNRIVVMATMKDVEISKDWDTLVDYYYKHYPAVIERLFNENGYEIEKQNLAPTDTN
jgi:hypothetical protein